MANVFINLRNFRFWHINSISFYERETAYGQIISKALKMENELERAQYIIEEISKVKSLYLMSNDEVVKFTKYMLLNARINKENVGIAKGFAGKDKGYRRV